MSLKPLLAWIKCYLILFKGVYHCWNYKSAVTKTKEYTWRLNRGKLKVFCGVKLLAQTILTCWGYLLCLRLRMKTSSFNKKELCPIFRKLFKIFYIKSFFAEGLVEGDWKQGHHTLQIEYLWIFIFGDPQCIENEEHLIRTTDSRSCGINNYRNPT